MPLPCQVVRNDLGEILLLLAVDGAEHSKPSGDLACSVHPTQQGTVFIHTPSGTTENLPRHVRGWLDQVTSLSVVLMQDGRHVVGGYQARLEPSD